MFYGVGWVREKLDKVVHKVIFLSPLDVGEEKFVVVKQVYCGLTEKEIKVEKGRIHSFSLRDWVYQRGQVFVHFYDFKREIVYGMYVLGKIVKPDGHVLTPYEIETDSINTDMKALFKGAGVTDWVMILLAAFAAGGLCLFIGYNVLPSVFGQHLVANPTPIAKMVGLLFGRLV